MSKVKLLVAFGELKVARLLSPPESTGARLIEENNRMKDVIAQITAENLDLKKTLSD